MYLLLVLDIFLQGFNSLIMPAFMALLRLELFATFECGIAFEDFSDMQVGDNVEVFIYVEENDKR